MKRAFYNKKYIKVKATVSQDSANLVKFAV